MRKVLILRYHQKFHGRRSHPRAPSTTQPNSIFICQKPLKTSPSVAGSVPRRAQARGRDQPDYERGFIGAKCAQGRGTTQTRQGQLPFRGAPQAAAARAGEALPLRQRAPLGTPCWPHVIVFLTALLCPCLARHALVIAGSPRPSSGGKPECWSPV